MKIVADSIYQLKTKIEILVIVLRRQVKQKLFLLNYSLPELSPGKPNLWRNQVDKYQRCCQN